MPPRVLLLLPLGALLLSGCSSTQHHAFHGRVENLQGDHHVEQGTHPAHVLRLEREPATRTYMAIQLDPETALVISFVEPASNLPAEIHPPQLKAWLTSLPIPGRPLSDQIDSSSSRTLHGPIKLDWQRPGIFSLTMNLRSKEEPPAIIHGTVKTERDWHLHY